jgi:hypothetical protein
VATDLDGQVPAREESATMPMKSVPGRVLPAAYRPVLPDHGPGRWFRTCAGIKEDVLDWSPAERAKYTGLGIIVLNTGCLAAFAMFTALDKIVSAPPYALVPLALAWGWIIFSVDRWLIASTHGVRGLSRVFIFIPRLLLAILLAFTIAEPLTLRISRTRWTARLRPPERRNSTSTRASCRPAIRCPGSGTARRPATAIT